MSMYTLVVFDWDGTLMDSTHSIVAAIKAPVATWSCLCPRRPMPAGS